MHKILSIEHHPEKDSPENLAEKLRDLREEERVKILVMTDGSFLSSSVIEKIFSEIELGLSVAGLLPCSLIAHQKNPEEIEIEAIPRVPDFEPQEILLVDNPLFDLPEIARIFAETEFKTLGMLEITDTSPTKIPPPNIGKTRRGHQKPHLTRRTLGR